MARFWCLLGTLGIVYVAAIKSQAIHLKQTSARNSNFVENFVASFVDKVSHKACDKDVIQMRRIS